MPVTRVLVAGVSTRAAAASAARAGYDVSAVDGFGDLDQDSAVRSSSVAPFTPAGAVRAACSVDCDAVAYLSSFENHPNAVAALARGRTLWGNPPSVLREVRNPIRVAAVFGRHGVVVPKVCTSRPGFGAARWLVKPLASGGGQRVRPWQDEAHIPAGCYLQEYVDGTPGSVVFVAAKGRAVPIGVSRQLIGEAAFGSTDYHYCGNILASAGRRTHDLPLTDAAMNLARIAARAFDLVGVNGIDFIARGKSLVPIEINPRWCASMELVERAYGLSVFAMHAAACSKGELPTFALDVALARPTHVRQGHCLCATPGRRRRYANVARRRHRA